MTSPVSYELQDGVATIIMDDGKANALSPTMLDAINAALDRAQTDRAGVLLTGREGKFSGGFDLKVIGGGGDNALRMLMGGFRLAERVLGFPAPVVIACNGHALAMGAFLLMAGDIRIGAEGDFKIGANEVAIGLNMPHTAVEMCRQRLTPAHFNRAMITSHIYSPTEALEAGFLDEVAPEKDLLDTARATAIRLSKYSRSAYAWSKQLTRAVTLERVHDAVAADEKIFHSFLPGGKPA
jgi:enoyl-CoA hydratase